MPPSSFVELGSTEHAALVKKQYERRKQLFEDQLDAEVDGGFSMSSQSEDSSFSGSDSTSEDDELFYNNHRQNTELKKFSSH